VDPSGEIITKYVDEDGVEIIPETNDGNDATVTIKNEDKEAFLDAVQEAKDKNWSMDGMLTNESLIRRFGDGMSWEQGATVQNWAVSAFDNSGDLQGFLLSSGSMSAGGIAHAAGEIVSNRKGVIGFDTPYNRHSPVPKSVVVRTPGGNFEIGRKTLSRVGSVAKVGGGALGAYGLYNTYDAYDSGQIGGVEAGADATFGVIGFLGWKGAVISTSYSLGKVAGPSKWYGSDDSRWFR
jgi:hypothetical protein